MKKGINLVEKRGTMSEEEYNNMVAYQQDLLGADEYGDAFDIVLHRILIFDEAGLRLISLADFPRCNNGKDIQFTIPEINSNTTEIISLLKDTIDYIENRENNSYNDWDCILNRLNEGINTLTQRF